MLAAAGVDADAESTARDRAESLTVYDAGGATDDADEEKVGGAAGAGNMNGGAGAGGACLFSVQSTRVPVQTGHLINLRCKTSTAPPSRADVLEVLGSYKPAFGGDVSDLPSYGGHDVPIKTVEGTVHPTYFFNEEMEDMFERPPQWVTSPWRSIQVVVGDVNTDDDVFDVSLNLVVDNIMRGAFLGALLTAELFFRYHPALAGSEEAQALVARAVNTVPNTGPVPVASLEAISEVMDANLVVSGGGGGGGGGDGKVA